MTSLKALQFLSYKSSLKFLRFSFALKNQVILSVSEPTFSEAEVPSRGGQASVKVALRVGGGTRSATFETQSEFFRKESKDRA